MAYIVGFEAEGSQDQDLVGGKAANLGRMTAAGFQVPPGFTVTTDAYSAFLEADGRAGEVAGRLDGLDYADADAVESATAAIRELIGGPDLPEPVAKEILDAYAGLGDGSAAVAVRSSGTAEDLEGTSFAGLHDTYLEIVGGEQVLDAIGRCWASLWSARATSYRHDQGFGATEARIAVVVQQMVSAEVAGVMFTANPVTAAVDETIVNASWGLGEAVVSGLVTPDEFALDRASKNVKRMTLGDKNVRIVRTGDGSGTTEEAVPADEAAARSLDDAQLRRLGALGQRVTDHYEGFPQDIEWAYAGGEFYLLQARPVTGVELSWDEDLEYFHYGTENDPDRPEFIYTRAWSDDFSVAAITALYYTTRSKEWSDNYHIAQVLWGNEKAASLRSWKYHKGEAYFSANMEAAWIPKVLPPYLREPGSMNKVPPSWWAELEAAPFSWPEYLRMYARIQFLDGRSGPYSYIKAFQERIDDEEEGNGVDDEALQAMSDGEFTRYLDKRLDLWRDADADQWGSFFLYAPFAMGTMAHLLVQWYDGDIGAAFAELLSGLPEASITLIENHEIWQFGERIKGSELLRRLLDEHQGEAFFAELANHEEGREFLADYEPWKVKRGHRGAGDRDFILPRRIDDPSIDYNSFVALMEGDSSDPLAMEDANRRKRADREDDVYGQISKGFMGRLKLELFKAVQGWSLDFMKHRDNEREYLDRLAYVQRRCFVEMGRRLHERGRIDDPMDVFHLGLEEAYALLDSDRTERLCRAKIAGRERNFLRRQRIDVVLPYIGTDGGPALPGELIGSISATDSSVEDGRTILPGGGTSGGIVTGRARVIKDLKNIGQLQKGDILICHATDPGWTPVFLVIGGLVMQTGGVLAHGSCLSREYGLPAVVVPEAMSRIEDGATVTLNGDLGRVELHPGMSRVEYVDQTCRDGQQSLWGMQMRAGHILPVAELIDSAGYRVVDLTGSGMFTVLTRFHRENPWRGLDLIRAAFPTATFRFGKRSNGLSGMGVAADSIIELFMKKMCDHGVGSVWIFDCLHDVPKMRETARTARRLGLAPSLQVNFSESPIHTDDYYAGVIAELAAEPAVETIILGDEAGVLGTERARTWIPLMKSLAGDVPVEMHFHDNTGQAAMNHIIGVEAGVTILHTAARGMANGVSMPSTQISVDNMRRLGHEVTVDPTHLDEVSDHFEAIARMEGYSVGAPVEFSQKTVESQIPGGMMGTLRDQLAREGMLHLLPELLEEAVQVRAELGYPIMATPYSQLVGIQALMNVIEGERYEVIPDENLMYCAGWYGEPPGPIADFVLERAFSTARGREIRAGEPPQPTIEEMRLQYGDASLSDEELLLRFMINPSFVDRMLADEAEIRPIHPLTGELGRSIGAVKNSSARAIATSLGGVGVQLRRD